MGRRVGLFIVDDEPDVRMLISLIVKSADRGLVVTGEAESGDDALIDGCLGDAHVVVLDQMMPGLSGTETATRLRAEHPHLGLILCSAHLTDEIRALAEQAGVDVCLTKAQIAQIPDEARRLAYTA